MNAAPDPNWEPDSQLLAAYLDGEFEGRDDLAELRARVEAWLQTHPEAREDCAQLQKLQKMWIDTTPAEPGSVAWEQCRIGITANRTQVHHLAPPPRRTWFAGSVLVAAVAVLVGVLLGVWRSGPADVGKEQVVVHVPKTENIEVFEVARSNEITILRIEGADTDSFVVGILPLVGILELADPGEVRVLNVLPEGHHQTIPNVRAQGRPMIWARLEVE